MRGLVIRLEFRDSQGCLIIAYLLTFHCPWNTFNIADALSLLIVCVTSLREVDTGTFG